MKPSLTVLAAALSVVAVSWFCPAITEAAEPAKRDVRVAGVVLKWIRGDKAANYRRAEPMIREAAAGGANIVCTTECFLDGYAIADKSIPLDTYRALGEVIPDGLYFQKLSRLAAELHVYLIVGMLEADGEERLNTAAMIGPDGKLIGRYHKQRLGHESIRNTAGKVSSVFETEFGKSGVMICADRRYPDVVGGFCQRGADFLICPSGGMFGPQRNDPILQARSRENRRHLVFVHPAEFLVTAPDGSIVKRTLLGDRLFLTPEDVDTEADSKQVFYFDLPLPKALAIVPEGQGKPLSAKYDMLILGGSLIDGSGTPARKSDIGIRDGRIVEIGSLKDAAAKLKIDAKGHVVAPGFIDLHSHADSGILQHRAAENYIRQGVTTLLCGNCGSSPTDVRKFFESVSEAGVGPNVALLIGHGSVRERIMGAVNARPTPEQLEKMKTFVRQAMQDGAVGLSTSLRYGPGTYADTDEIVALAKEIAPFGGFYATHMRDEGTRILEAIEESLLIGERAGVPVHISHHKISSASVFGMTRQTLARIDEVRAAGRDVTLDQYPYGAGSGGMTIYVPQWSLSGGLEKFRERLKDAESKSRILASMKDLLIRKIYEADQTPDNAAHTAKALSRIRVARSKHDESLEGKSLTDILRQRKQDVSLDNGCELLLELVSHGTRGINHTLEQRPGGDVDRVMLHPQSCIASDGSVFPFGEGNPHPRSYGCFPRVLGRYVRQRNLISLEEAIRKMTSLPASRLGWKDRGVIRKGSWADVVVFDPKEITDHATFATPHRHSTGVKDVIVRGRTVLADGKLTGELPGQPLSLGK